MYSGGMCHSLSPAFLETWASTGLLHDQEQTNRFFGTFAGTVAASEFFAPENLAQIMGRTRRGWSVRADEVPPAL